MLRKFVLLAGWYLFSVVGGSTLSALTLDDGRYLVLDRETGTFEISARDEELSLPDGRKLKLNADGTFLFLQAGKKSVKLKDGRLLFLESEQKYAYYEGETVDLGNGLSVSLQPDSTYEIRHQRDHLYPLRDGSLIWIKNGNRFSFLDSQFDFSYFWRPLIAKVRVISCQDKLRTEAQLQDLANLHIQMDHLLELMESVGVPAHRRKELMEMRMRTQYAPVCSSPS
jgi:hypothetical protein